MPAQGPLPSYMGAKQTTKNNIANLYMNNWKTMIAAAAICLCCPHEAQAIRAYPHPVTVMQPDGTTITVRIHGDENLHYTTTTDGFMLERDEAGFFRYVSYDFVTGQRTLTAQRAHDMAARTAAETALTATLADARQISLDMRARRTAPAKAPARTLKTRAMQGGKKLAPGQRAAESQYLVILVGFADRAFSFANADFSAWLNEPGYSHNGGTGSVKDYYRDNSMGQFVPNFTVVGPYTLGREQAYYAGNDASTGEDAKPRDMVSEACSLAKQANPGLDFAQFDNDGDGFMDNCYVIYAGYSEASTANADDMWPHSWQMGEQAFSIDGVTIDNYSCSAELVGMPGAPAEPTMDGIGTFTHEFGHILGLKDTYDTDNYTDGMAVDLGAYDLYSSGSYNNDSRTPPCLMAFERMQLGWATEGTDIAELSGPEDVTLESVASNKARYINARPNLPEGEGMEWFMLENRQQEGWDRYIPAHGLLIYHYDYTRQMQDDYWSVNGPNNNAKHRGVYIVAADGVDDNNSRPGDTYPGSSANTAFTDNTKPASLNWAGNPVGVPVTNILEAGGKVMFQVAGGTTEWNFVRTEVPTAVRDTAATFAATITGRAQGVAETGFCWAASGEPTINGSHAEAQAAGDAFTLTVNGLMPGANYSVRAYMRMDDGTLVYGSAVPFATECEAVGAPFVADFTSWTNGQPDCWQIVDRNGDGSTWVFDEASNAVLYQFDYWNDADDWLICKRRIRVPERGALYITRGISGTTTVEDLEVYVSERTSDIDDFYLCSRLSFADYFDQQHMEEIDLSRYAGKDIYIALRCASAKLQNNLWLWYVAVMQKLQTPAVTYFGQPEPDVLRVEWTPVDGALYYYLFFGKETSEPNEAVVFAPMDFYEKAEGGVKLGVGTMTFTGNATVELKELPGGITDCKFIVTTSGPSGESALVVEGSADGGATWTPVGPRVSLAEYDSEGQECDWQAYVQGQGLTKLRFSFTHGGRNGQVKYLTLGYNDGNVVEALSEGGVYGTSQDIPALMQGEFDQGRYVVWVAAGDGTLFYDESPRAYYERGVTDAITEAMAGTGISLTSAPGELTLHGLPRGSRVECSLASGVTLFSGAAQGTLAIPTRGHRGVVVVSVEAGGRTHVAKAVAR